MVRVLLTGGCGFIGSHLCEHLLKNTDWHIVIFDKLTYASNGLDRLRDIETFCEARVSVFTTDIAEPIPPGIVQEAGDIRYVIHTAAESHVDNSIRDPAPFVVSNVLGTMHILNYARNLSGLDRFIYFSTDEIFGPALPDEKFREWDRYNSSNPYAATKAGGEELCLAYANTYQMPIVCMHTMNVFGQRQHHEKFIPKVARSVLTGDTVPIHATPDKTKAGSRFYIHARNVADAVMFLLQKGQFRDKYNIVGEREVDNLTLAQSIATIVGKPLNYEMVNFHSSRPGHDLRYALDGGKMASMGWVPPTTFDESLETTIKWMIDNPIWLGL